MNRQARKVSYLLLTAALFLLVIASAASAAPNIREKGTLEAIEEGGRSVTIMTQAPSVDKVEREHRAVYRLVSNIIVIDGSGRRTKLDVLPLPVKIEFDVEYTPTGALIKKIMVKPQ